MNPENFSKPPSLFHGSPKRDIETLEPRQKSRRSSDEGAVVFATPDIGLASIFILESNDNWTQIGKIKGQPYIVICMDRDEFISKDKGGTIYELPNHTFTNDPNRGMGRHEWTSGSPVKPLKAMHYDTTLDAMLQHGVKVYFVAPDVFERIKKAPNGGEEIIETLTPEK